MKALKIVSILVFSLMLTSTAFAQECTAIPPCQGIEDDEVPLGSPGSGPGGSLGPGEFYCCPNPTVPFDGGVSFLIAAGLSIGGYSIFKRKKTVE